MTRSHRRWHAWLWLVLGPLLAAGFVSALLARPHPPPKGELKPTQTEVSP